jgi:hypothetical protein
MPPAINFQKEKNLTLKDASIQAIITLASTILLLQLWKTDLRVPINYWGDTIYELALVKSIADGGWIWFIERLGAPFGLELSAFPQNLTTSSVAMKIISLFTKEPGLILNTFWIGSIATTSVFSYVALRSLGASRGSGFILSTLYALMPYSLFRNTAHISLTYIFIAPVAAFAIKNLAQNELTKNEVFLVISQERIIFLGCCIAIGFDYIYNSFFSCFFLIASGLIGSITKKSWNPLRRSLPPILIILTCVVVNLTPTALSWNRTGVPTSMDYKNPAEAEVYGLKIRHVLSPLVTNKNINFPLENENQFSTPGVVGSLGFLTVILFGLTGKDSKNSKFGWSAGRLTIIGTMLATIGGFGSVFNVMISPDIRAYNRIIVFLGFFSFFAASIILDSLHNRLRVKFDGMQHERWINPFIWVSLISILALGLLGNSKYAIPITSKYQTFKNQEVDEREFVNRIEREFPEFSQIYQLPETNFPPDGGRNRLLTYDHGRAYLWSNSIHWSWPNFSNVQRAWSKNIGSPGTPSFLDGLVISGFSGVWVDRFGYTSPELEKLEAALRTELGPAVATSESGRYTLFSLGEKLTRWTQETSTEERVKAKNLLVNPVELVYKNGFFTQEIEAATGVPFRWSNQTSTAYAYNTSKRILKMELRGLIRSNPGGTVSIQANGIEEQFKITNGMSPISFEFDIKPQSKLKLEFQFIGRRIDAPDDSREMYFSIANPSLHEVN